MKNCAESAISGAAISQDHEGCCSLGEALAEIWAVSFLTDRMKSAFPEKLDNSAIEMPRREPLLEPFRFIWSRLLYPFHDYPFTCHGWEAQKRGGSLRTHPFPSYRLKFRRPP